MYWGGALSRRLEERGLTPGGRRIMEGDSWEIWGVVALAREGKKTLSRVREEQSRAI